MRRIDFLDGKPFKLNGDSRRADRYRFVHAGGLLVNGQYACMVTNVSETGFTMDRFPFDPKVVQFEDCELKEVIV
jgi:hypothetical protein